MLLLAEPVAKLFIVRLPFVTEMLLVVARVPIPIDPEPPLVPVLVSEITALAPSTVRLPLTVRAPVPLFVRLSVPPLSVKVPAVCLSPVADLDAVIVIAPELTVAVLPKDNIALPVELIVRVPLLITHPEPVLPSVSPLDAPVVESVIVAPPLLVFRFPVIDAVPVPALVIVILPLSAVKLLATLRLPELLAITTLPEPLVLNVLVLSMLMAEPVKDTLPKFGVMSVFKADSGLVPALIVTEPLEVVNVEAVLALPITTVLLLAVFVMLTLVPLSVRAPRVLSPSTSSLGVLTPVVWPGAVLITFTEPAAEIVPSIVRCVGLAAVPVFVIEILALAEPVFSEDL